MEASGDSRFGCIVDGITDVFVGKVIVVHFVSGAWVFGEGRFNGC